MRVRNSRYAADPLSARTAPAPGQAPLPAPNAAALLRRNGTDASVGPRPAIRFEDRVWTHSEFLAESIRWANMFLQHGPSTPDGVLHVGVLLDNTPEYLFALGGAALSGAVVVGLNHTRRDENLWRDIDHTHVGLIVTEAHHRALLEPFESKLPPVLEGDGLERALAAVTADDAGVEPDVTSRWALIFTSGTSSAPKAVICTQRRLLQTGARMAAIMDLGADDVGYVCMPLFHSNALMVGWAPSIAVGASVGLARRFTASGWLRDVRHYGATYFNYTGKPLSYLVATPERPDDAANPLRVAFGNEGSPEVVDLFSRRFGVEVIDAFGATEGGIAVNRDDGVKFGSVGKVGETVKVVDDDGRRVARGGVRRRRQPAERRRVRRRDREHRREPDRSRATTTTTRRTAATLRNGWYWSGDLGYVDDDGFLYFAGRTAEWIRVDGENFPAGPIESAIGRHPDVVLAAVYGVPDEHAGDQVMAAVQMRPGVTFDGATFAAFVDGLADVGPKWRPRYVRVVGEFPTTGTNKVVKRTLVREKYRRDLCRRRRAVDAWPRRGRLPALHPARRGRAPERTRHARAAGASGISRWTCRSPPAEAAFAAEIRAWLEENLDRPARVRIGRGRARVGTGMASPAGRRPLGGHPLAQ